MNTAEKLKLYEELLRKWQKTINLVAPDSLAEAGTRHFDDSAQLADLIPAGAKKLFDLGSGAGFPGLVLAMMRPELEVHLVESDQRKCAFLSTVSRETQTKVTIHNERVENFSAPIIPDVVTARALAPLVKLMDLVLPWAEKNPDLVLLFPKGAQVAAEMAEAQKKYSFTVSQKPSRTSEEAVILTIAGLAVNK